MALKQEKCMFWPGYGIKVWNKTKNLMLKFLLKWRVLRSVRLSEELKCNRMLWYY